MDLPHFEFPEIFRRCESLHLRLGRLLNESTDPKVTELSRELAILSHKDECGLRQPLGIALVGQYNAGKSTIITALTGRSDIPVDADVCTDKVTAYEWDGVLLLDTPGIHAGYPDHDAVTYTAIDRADLLVFVITNELFDDCVGSHFRDLVFSKHKAREIMLVVNKMGQDPGTPDVKKPFIDEVTAPLKCEDFRTVFIDALAWLDAQEQEDPVDRDEFIRESNMVHLTDELNKFVQERGLMGRLTTPLFSMRSLAAQAAAFLGTDMPEERVLLVILHRKRGIFYDSRARLKVTLQGFLNNAVTDVILAGDQLAETFRPESTEEAVQKGYDQAVRKCQDRCDILGNEAQEAIAAEFQELKRRLEELQAGPLARQLKGALSMAVSKGSGTTKRPSLFAEGADVHRDWGSPERSRRLQKVGKMAQDIGGVTTKWATGPFASAANVGTATAARGSDAHKVVYTVGKFFGVKFQPWGAVKVAKHIGNAGRIIGVVGGVLAVAGQIADDLQQEQQRKQLRSLRHETRTTFRDIARSIEESFWDRFDLLNRDFYEKEIRAIELDIRSLTEGQRTRSNEAEAFQSVENEATKLIELVQLRCPSRLLEA